jgi:hypothetical protein
MYQGSKIECQDDKQRANTSAITGGLEAGFHAARRCKRVIENEGSMVKLK